MAAALIYRDVAALAAEWDRAADEMRPKYDMENGYLSLEDGVFDGQADIYAECAAALRRLLEA